MPEDTEFLMGGFHLVAGLCITNCRLCAYLGALFSRKGATLVFALTGAPCLDQHRLTA